MPIIVLLVMLGKMSSRDSTWALLWSLPQHFLPQGNEDGPTQGSLPVALLLGGRQSVLEALRRSPLINSCLSCFVHY